jgi:hypothetical protein
MAARLRNWTSNSSEAVAAKFRERRLTLDICGRLLRNFLVFGCGKL